MRATDQLTPCLIVIRLSHDVAARLEREIPPHQRDDYFQELVQRDLELRDEADIRQLIEAAEQMNRLEAENPELLRESEQWLNADLTSESDGANDDLDHKTFEREFRQAPMKRP